MARRGRGSGRTRFWPRRSPLNTGLNNHPINSSNSWNISDASSRPRGNAVRRFGGSRRLKSRANDFNTSDHDNRLRAQRGSEAQKSLDSSPPVISIENEAEITSGCHSQALESSHDSADNTSLPVDASFPFNFQEPNLSDSVIEEQSEVIVALDMRPGKNFTLGCAYYMANEERLYFMEDCKMGDISLIDTLRLHIEPTVILVPTRINDEILNYLQPEQACFPSSDNEGNDSQNQRLYDLQIRALREFKYENGKSKLLGLGLSALTPKVGHFVVPGDSSIRPGMKDGRGRQESALQMSNFLDPSCELAVGCAGAVIAYLNRLRAQRFLPGDENAASFFRIQAVEMFSLQGSMFVNANSLKALQVIETVVHPNSENHVSNKLQDSKGSLSLHGLFQNYTYTPLGKRRLRQLFLRPVAQVNVLNDRLSTVSAFCQPSNAPHLGDIIGYLKGIGDIKLLIRSLRKGTLGSQRGNESSVKMWERLLRFTHSALCIRDSIREMQSMRTLRIFDRMMNGFDGPSLASVGEAISRVVDFEGSNTIGYPVVHQGLDEELDELKRRFNGLESWLGEVSKHIREIIPPECQSDLTSVDVTYYPRIGFVIQINAEATDSIEGHFKFTERPWELAFVTGGHANFKSPEMDEMDQKFDKEVEILHSLAQNILVHESEIEKAADLCAEIDCFISLALGARNYSLVCPQLTEENVVDIRAGRHLLQEISVPSYVPNDTFIKAGKASASSSNDQLDISSDESEKNQTEMTPSVIIMTGPNYSGKSVYLKQVALIVYMAHIGSFVPAESATIGITDKILTRIATKESVSKIQSSFGIDLQQMSFALSQATPRSLLIVDEFGKGTQPDDGAALFCGVMEYLLSLEDRCPKVLASTHFHELFENGFLSPKPRLSFAHMEVRVDPTAAETENQLVYLYIARKGRSISTFGACCAALNGIDRRITDRAEELILLQTQREDLVAACSSLPPAEMADLEIAEQMARFFLATNIEETDPRLFLHRCLEEET